MGVGVDEARENGDVAEVFNRAAIVFADSGNQIAID